MQTRNSRLRHPAASRAAAPLSPASALASPPIASPGPAGADQELLAPASRETVPALSTATTQKVRAILAEGTAPATARAHAGDVAYFWAWAGEELALPEHYPAPAAAVVQFVADHLEGLRPATDAALLERCRRGLPGGKARLGVHSLATIRRRLASLSKAHQLAGVPNPCALAAVREILSRARRREVRRGGHGARRKLAATREILEALLAKCGEDLAGRRDRALLLFAFASGGRRRSEVVAARCEDLER